MKVQKEKGLIKMIILVLVVICIDIILEYGITLVKLNSHILDDYLVSGIIIQSFMLITGIVLYYLFIDKHVISTLFPKKTYKTSMKYVHKFLLVFPVLLIFIYFMVYLFDPSTWLTLQETTLTQEPPLWKIIIFEAIFPGLGEEMLYRGFLLSLLVYSYMMMNKSLLRKHMILSILLSSIIFSIAHFGYQFTPFNITYDAYQLVTAFLLGSVEGYVFLRTKNLCGPILIHNASNLMLSVFPLMIGLIF
jgi:membrane protease YdiL (CAAX protease family)